MILTNDNYYSQEANWEYFSVSQFKDFMKCEAAALAKIRGEYSPPPTRAMLVGSFVDSYFECGSIDRFLAEHPAVFTRSGKLRAEFRKANEIIGTVLRDETFANFMSGEKQKILTFELFGVLWKMKMDSFVEGKCITDLKVVATLDKKKRPHIHDFRYDIQGVIYQAGVELNGYGRLPFYLAAATKEKVIDFDIYQIPQLTLGSAYRDVQQNIERFSDVKRGIVKPHSCGLCDYCKSVKKAAVKDYNELLM